MQSNGNEEYFTQVYKKYHSYAIRCLTRDYSLPYQTVEDLAQDVFSYFWSAIIGGRFDKERDPKPFIATIAHHQIAKHFRKYDRREYVNSKGRLIIKIRPRFCGLTKAEFIDRKANTPLEEIIAKERRELIQNCLDYVESNIYFRTAQSLKLHVEGDTTSEIARKLGVSTGCIGRNIFHMRKKLRKKFAKELQELYED